MSKRILIVEDDVSQCLQLSDLLNEFGFETAVAGDGLKALEILEVAKPLPDIILLDLDMPRMNGWQLREVLKTDPLYCQIKILIMSGCDAAIDVQADSHFPKPLDLGILLRALQ